MNATFGDFIREVRLSKDWSQEECAQALGYQHRSSMHRLESGEREWTLANLTDFAKLLGLTPAKLLSAYEIRD